MPEAATHRRLLLAIVFFFFTEASTFPMQHFSRSELSRIAGYGEERLSSVLVVGTIVCDTYLDHLKDISTTSHVSVSGAKVAVACKAEGTKRKINWVHGTTDEFGEFMIDMPSHLHAIPKLEEACAVKVLQVSRNSACRIVSGVKPKGLKLSSVGNCIRVYSIGIIRLNDHSNQFF